MANRVPLIINTTANQIQELALGDCLDLTASGIHNAGVITATKFVGDGSLLTNVSGGGGAAGISDIVEDITPQLGGNLDINGNIINGTGSIVITGGIQATSFTGSVVGDVTGNVSGSAGSASGLTGNPAIQVASIVATGHIQAETVSVASTLTYEDVTSIDSIGIVTARSGIKVLGGGIDAVGTITATSFSGDGSGLTNVGGGINDIVDDTTPQLGGNLDINGKTINGTGNITITGNVTATNLSGSLPSSNLTGALPAIDGSALTGIAASPGGSDTEFQYNNAGSFEGLERFTFDSSRGIILDERALVFDASGERLRISTTNNNSYIHRIGGGGLELKQTYGNSSIFIDTNIQIRHNNVGVLTTTESGIVLSGVTTSNTFEDTKGDLRTVPLNDQQASANYDLISTDAGKCIHAHATTTQVTVKNSVFAPGDMVTILNGDANNLTITEDSGFALRNSGDGTTGNRVLGAFGMATIYFSGTSVGYISGAGLS
tara:strand:+ start:813 stop:2285 length:1473 start_codon:yes stop_codon:yes gene_type:complete